VASLLAGALGRGADDRGKGSVGIAVVSCTLFPTALTFFQVPATCVVGARPRLEWRVVPAPTAAAEVS